MDEIKRLRIKLWIDVFAGLKTGWRITAEDAAKSADAAVEEFDRRFDTVTEKDENHT